jgi:hypothetical protein
MQKQLDPRMHQFLEEYVLRWLRKTMLGQSMVREFGMEAATDGVFEMLNLGYLKIIADEDGLTGIETRFPPVPPLIPIVRTRSPAN